MAATARRACHALQVQARTMLGHVPVTMPSSEHATAIDMGLDELNEDLQNDESTDKCCPRDVTIADDATYKQPPHAHFQDASWTFTGPGGYVTPSLEAGDALPGDIPRKFMVAFCPAQLPDKQLRAGTDNRAMAACSLNTLRRAMLVAQQRRRSKNKRLPAGSVFAQVGNTLREWSMQFELFTAVNRQHPHADGHAVNAGRFVMAAADTLARGKTVDVFVVTRWESSSPTYAWVRGLSDPPRLRVSYDVHFVLHKRILEPEEGISD